MTSWPRGLLSYVPSGPDDATPSADEDRTANRLALAARLVSVQRSRGAEMAGPIRELRAAQAAYAAHDRARAAELVDRLLGELEPSPRPEGPSAAQR